MAKDYSKKNPQQLLKVSGKDTFVEVLNNGFEIGKVMINFAKYDENKPQGERMTDNVTIYMDMDKALLLAKDILSGKIAALAEKEKAGGKKYPGAIFTEMGGTSAAALANKGKSRPDGGSESRQFKIQPGSKVPFMLVGERGRGEENATGLIVPKSSEVKVMVPFSVDDLKIFAIVVESHINAYRVARYVDGSAMTNSFQENKNKGA